MRDTYGAAKLNEQKALLSRILVENSLKLVLSVFIFLIAAVSVRAEPARCQSVTYWHSGYTVCEVDLRLQSVRLFWKKPDGQPYEYLSSLPRALANHSRRLLFATNGGMYHPDNSPVGLYIEEGQELVRANTSAGPGNFHMRPNGVFYVTGEVAGILETSSFIKQRPRVDFATQSGPMLVIDGEVHARFDRYDGSKKYRAGVGSREPNLVVFAVSESEVSFSEFARLFRDKLRCKNALFLDGGTATSFYSPVLGRNSNLLPLGPIIGVYGPN
jgi:uncharacterized protein YigE (DUF2233 family)